MALKKTKKSSSGGTPDTGVRRKSGRLAGLKIAFGVCGGIGSVEVVKIIRELRRHGAEVTAFLSPETRRFVGDLSLQWATDRTSVRRISSHVEYLVPFDLAVVAPLTLNSLSKIANGISDNPVTLMAACQIGRRAPLLLVPTMNDVMTSHPLFDEHLSRLKSWGVVIYDSPHEEGRLKMPREEDLVATVLRMVR